MYIKNYDQDTFAEMIRDWKSDQGPEMDNLIIDKIEFDSASQAWIATAHDNKSTYALTDDGNGNITINYLGAL